MCQTTPENTKWASTLTYQSLQRLCTTDGVTCPVVYSIKSQVTNYPSCIVCHLQFTLSEQQFAKRNKLIEKIKELLCECTARAQEDQAKRMIAVKGLNLKLSPVKCILRMLFY